MGTNLTKLYSFILYICLVGSNGTEMHTVLVGNRGIGGAPRV